MNGDLHHIDDLFKSGLEGKEDNPSPAVWENIEKELDKKDSRPKFLIWWNTRKITAAVLIILGSAGLFAGGYYLRGIRMADKESQKTPSENRSSTSTSESIKPRSLDNEQLEVANDQLVTADQKNSSRDDQPAVSGPTLNEKTLLDKPKGDISEPEKTASNRQKSSGGIGKTVSELNNRNAPKKASLNVTTGTRIAKPGSENNKPTAKGSTRVEGKNDYVVPVTTDKNKVQPAGTSDNGISVIDTETKKTWETEQINTPAASRELPGSEKHLTTSGNSVKNAHGLTPATPPSAIPVLKKRDAVVDLPKFSLTPVASWQFGSNRIVRDNSYPDAGKVKAEIDRTESQPSMISGGLLADLRIAKNMTLQSGLIFTSRTIQIEPKYIKAERNPDGKVRYKFDCSAGTYYIKKSTYARPGDSALTKYSTNELNYINIPLSLTYHFGGKKFHLFATAGAGLNILTDQYLETGLHNYNYDENESIATNLKSNYFNGMIGAGINWQAFRKLSFVFIPQYQFGITPMNENMPVKAYPRMFNMQLGMQIRL